MPALSSRERMLLAMTNRQPDRVPVAPDMSNMIPCRLTGKPFWDVYYFNDPPIWQAYIEAMRYFGIDGWFTDGSMSYRRPYNRREIVDELTKTPERWLVGRRGRLDGLPYHTETTYYVADPPTPTGRPFTDIEGDWPLIEKWFAPATGWDPTLLEQQRKEVGEDAAFGIATNYPGLHIWFELFKGGLADLAEWYYFKHDWIEAFRELYDRYVMREMELILDARPDFVLLGGSGTLTLQSPKIARELSLPTIRKQTRMAKDAGIPTMIHSCGKERALVKWCAEETDLNCINPLEIAPMGDCDLAEVKQAHGHQIALMGNLHTTNVMLYGTRDEVEAAAVAAIDAAGAGGGFILSTGDQCGRDTPEENIFRLVEVAKSYGRY